MASRGPLGEEDGGRWGGAWNGGARGEEDEDAGSDVTMDSTATSLVGCRPRNGSLSSEAPSEAVPDKYGFLGGSQYTQPGLNRRVPLQVQWKRELKWRDMLENWERYMTKHFKKVRDRCRKGIPSSMRASAWQNLCGGRFLMESYPGKFAELDKHPGDPRWVDDIRKDLHRQFPQHEMFVKDHGHGQEDLFRILKAYSVLNPAVGYCQGQAPIAAVLLMHMPAEHAFWCLTALCDKYLRGYYSPGLDAVQLDGEILFALLKRVSPSAYRHLKKQRVDPIMYMTEWFMCAYSRTLPWSTVLRVWDVFFCEGVKVLFRVALVLLRGVLGGGDVGKRYPAMFETLEALRSLPEPLVQEDYLVTQLVQLDITSHDMVKEHQRQIAKRRLAQLSKVKT
ncbi:TBC1 domain family member 10B-like [Haemaphysalis longicornis]